MQEKRWRRADWWTAVLLFVGLSTVYFAATSGITSSNDGSHYALTRALAEYGRFTIDPFDPYAEGNDIAVRDGRFYSDRPPGTALVSALFYQAGGLLPEETTRLPSRHDAENPRLIAVMLLPIWAGAATAVLLFGLLRWLGVGRPPALAATILFALGTAHWKYSTVLFSHALSGFLIILSLALALYLGRRRGAAVWWHGVLGAVVGFSVLVEYSNGLLALLVGGYLLWGERPLRLKRLLPRFGLFTAAGLLSAAFLAYYNTVNFGGPLTLSYAYAINYPWAGAFGSTFSYPLLPGLQALLFWGEGGGWCGGACYNQGVFLLSPVLLPALPGWVWFGRRARREALFSLLIFLVYLLLFAKHHTSHGFTGDGRYLVPFLGILALPLGFTLAKVWAANRGRRPWLLLAVLTLFFLSWRNMFLHIGYSYNYTLDMSRLAPFVAAPQNWTYLFQSVFRNPVANWPLLWLIEALLFSLFGGIWRLRRRKSSSR